MKKSKEKVNLTGNNPTTSIETLEELKKQNSKVMKELDELIELVSKPKEKRK